MVLLGVLINAAIAQKPTVVLDNDPGWHKIGQITASFKLDNESIIVYGRDEFTKIKLKVTDAPILIERVQLFYEEGQMEELAVGTELQAGASTAALDLKGTNKELEKVVFTYKTLPNYQGDKATVELYGLKTRQDKSDAFRDDDGDDDDLENEVEGAEREVEEEVDQAEKELDEESREAREEAREAEENIEEGAEKTGDDVSEAAANAAAHVKDKVYVDKVGPEGQTIYINKHSQYYYISDDGKKVFVTKSQLKDKPQKN